MVKCKKTEKNTINNNYPMYKIKKIGIDKIKSNKNNLQRNKRKLISWRWNSTREGKNMNYSNNNMKNNS